jgi:hypothetical protein
MGPWIVAGIAISTALATLALVWARSSASLRGVSVSAAASWIVAALAWISLFAGNEDVRVNLEVVACASVLGVALTFWRLGRAGM